MKKSRFMFGLKITVVSIGVIVAFQLLNMGCSSESQKAESEPEKRLIGVKNISINEPFFNGHFPGNAVMPGVLIIESMAQAAGMLANLDAELHGKRGSLYYLVKVDKARFNKTVVPGDQLTLDVVQKRIIRNMGQYVCKAFVDGQRVASCELLCAGR